MKKSFSLPYIALVLAVSLPKIVFADLPDINDSGSTVKQLGFQDGDPTTLSKVLEGIWGNTVNSILLPLLSGIAVLFIIYAGIQYITAQGNAEGTKKARQNIINVLLGIILVITAFTLINLITSVARFFAGKY